jgi:Bacterial RNA polymerase, alpha chain C terminal domain
MTRNEAIYSRRLQGESFTSLAREFKISPAAVSQVFKQAERRAREEACGYEFRSLSVRALNCLKNSGIVTRADLDRIGPDEIRMWARGARVQRNFGAVTAQEIFNLMGWGKP